VIRVLMAEDQSMVRGALRALLELEEDITVVAEVGRGDLVLAAAREHAPDVALLDIEMPGQDGIEAARELAAELPAVRAVVLTTFGRPGFLRRAMEVGAAGFLVKDAPVAELARSIRAVVAGERVIDRDLAAAALAIGATPLSAREADVLREAADGATVADIAGCSCRRARCATTCPRRSARPAPAPGSRPPASPPTRAGSSHRTPAPFPRPRTAGGSGSATRAGSAPGRPDGGLLTSDSSRGPLVPSPRADERVAPDELAVLAVVPVVAEADLLQDAVGGVALRQRVGDHPRDPLVGEGLGDHGPGRRGGQTPPSPAPGDLATDLDDTSSGRAREAAPADQLRRLTRDDEARTPR
jgi:two-component system response regulator DesR